MAEFFRTTFCRVALLLLVIAQCHACVADESQSKETAATKKKKEVPAFPGPEGPPSPAATDTGLDVFQAAKKVGVL